MYDFIKVGYGRAIITPTAPVPLSGYGNGKNRISEVVRDDLMLTCIAFTDQEDNTVLMFTSDMISLSISLYEDGRKALSEKLGISEDNINIAATHTHSSVDWGETGFESVVAFRKRFNEAMVEAGLAAMEDRSEAVTYVNTVQTEGMNFIRHNKVADGTYTGDNFGSGAPGIIDHASASDPWIQIVRFVRPDHPKDILLMNWQAHPCLTGGINNHVLSADYIGEVRKYLEIQTGMRFAFFQGAAGNHNARSGRLHETRTEDVVEYGKLLGGYVLKGLASVRKISV